MRFLGMIVFTPLERPVVRSLFMNRRTMVVRVAVDSTRQEGMDFYYLFHYVRDTISMDVGNAVYECD